MATSFRTNSYGGGGGVGTHTHTEDRGEMFQVAPTGEIGHVLEHLCELLTRKTVLFWKKDGAGQEGRQETSFTLLQQNNRSPHSLKSFS